MSVFEMPLEELRRYTGINECPTDIETYWDRAITEMEALGTACTLKAAKFQVRGAECWEMTFTGVGGARIHARLAKPAHPQGKMPAVCRFHGYGGDCGGFSELLHWTAAGFAVASMDCRGQGGSSQDNAAVNGNTLHGHIIRGLDAEDADRLYYRSVFLDAAQLARIVMAMDDVDEARVCAEGASQGGGLTLACAALTPKLRCAAPKCPFLSDYRRVWEMDLAEEAYLELREYFRNFDPRHEREAEIFTKLGYIDVKNIAHRIRADVMLFTGLSDKICPPSTQFAAYNRIRSKKEIVLYPDFAHEYYPDADDIAMRFICENTGMI